MTRFELSRLLCLRAGQNRFASAVNVQIFAAQSLPRCKVLKSPRKRGATSFPGERYELAALRLLRKVGFFNRLLTAAFPAPNQALVGTGPTLVLRESGSYRLGD